MISVSQVESSLKHILEERANVLARETGCIRGFLHIPPETVHLAFN